MSLRAAKLVCRELGISDTTLWRWNKRGWIYLVNIEGRHYISSDSLAEFERRAKAGEFAKQAKTPSRPALQKGIAHSVLVTPASA